MKKKFLPILLSITVMMSSVPVYADEVAIDASGSNDTYISVQGDSQEPGESQSTNSEVLTVTISEITNDSVTQAEDNTAKVPTQEQLAEVLPVELLSQIPPDEEIMPAVAEVSISEETGESSPTVEEEPSPVEIEESDPVITEDPGPAVSEAPSPVVSEEPDSVVTELPSPVVAEAPNSAVTEAPSPIDSEVKESQSTDSEKESTVCEESSQNSETKTTTESYLQLNPIEDSKEGGNLNGPLSDYINNIARDTFTKSVQNISTSMSPTGRYNASFTLIEKNNITGVEKKYLYTVSGFSDVASVESYINTIISYENRSSELIYDVINQNFVDAEKKPWAYIEGDEHPEQNAYDSNLCWAGSTSDMLALSGWNKANIINLHGNNVINEDRLFDLFANNFTDKAGNQIYGVEWFFNGTYQAQGSEGWAQLKNEMGYSDAFLKEYCVDDFVKSYKYPGEDELANILKKLDSDEDGDRCSIGLVFGYYDKDDTEEVVRNGGHCVTIVGYSTDENGVPTTITIADSDSYNEEIPTYSADNVRDDYNNVYKTYPIEYYNGNWHLMNFSYSDNIIDDLIVLKYYSDNTKDKLEVGGTLDLINNLDYYADMQRVFSDDYRDIVSTIYQGDLLHAGFRIRENSIYKEYDSVDYLPYRFEISKDGSIVRTVDDRIDVSSLLDGGVGYFIGSTIMDSNSPLEPGEYTVSYILNYDKHITEAYYNNNKLENKVKFVVLKKVDEDGAPHYVVVPEKNSSSSDNNEEKEALTKYIQELMDNLISNKNPEYLNNPENIEEYFSEEGISVTYINNEVTVEITEPSKNNETSFDYAVVAKQSAFENEENIAFEVALSDVNIDSKLTKEELEAAEIILESSLISADGSLNNESDSKLIITKNDYKLESNSDGSLKVVFSNTFIRKLPKGVYYFKLIINGKSRIIKVEIK